MNHLLNTLRRFSKSWKRADAVFSKAYHRNMWGSHESVSGTGSEVSQTRVLIDSLPEIFKRFSVNSILDIPCGDLNWMKGVDLGGIRYIGADIVAPVIEKNLKIFQGENREFYRLNLITDDLPGADLIFCRDCFVHLSNQDILSSLANICRTEARLLATTTFTGRTENRDIPTGCWRPINLEEAPFFLPPPEMIVNEECTEADGYYTDKSLAVWEIRHLREKFNSQFKR